MDISSEIAYDKRDRDSVPFTFVMESEMQELEGRPEINYPCPWIFKLIGREEEQMRVAVAEIVGDHAYTLTFSNQSAQGTYCSLNLEMVVLDEPHRLSTFDALIHHHSIQIVL